MGKRIKLREAQRRAAEQAIAARLRAHSRPDSGPAFITSYGDFPSAYRQRIEPYRDLALRAPQDWHCQLRCRAPERRFLELVAFSFARYPVADHLTTAWLSPPEHRDELVRALAVADAGDTPDLCRWYIIAAQGRSLHKEATHPYLSSHETHHSVTAPAEVTSTVRAFWYGIARAATDDAAVALKVARSKLTDFAVTEPFWRDAARFFVSHPITILEINDLVDYLSAARQEDPRFSLAGRTLPALRRRMTEWHRMLRDIAGGGCWNGYRLPDVSYSDGPGYPVWRFRQIKSGAELAREGGRMAHCVASYREKCVRGDCSIWSLTDERSGGRASRSLTIELGSDRTILQCRGFGNRGASAEEVAIVMRWAAEHGLGLSDWLW
jgi:PcfJ-like protein